MLILNQNQIKNLFSSHEVLEAIERAFKIFHENKFEMPDRMHAHHEDITLLLMPCFTEGFFGTKLVSVNPKNTAIGKPSIYGSMILNDSKTGEPIALLNGAALTAVRTGAVGASGIKYTSKESAQNIGIIGTGIQGFTQAIFACAVRPVKKIHVFDLNEEKLAEFAASLQEKLPEVEICSQTSSETLVKESDVIICATSANEPVIPDDPELLRGKCFIGIGSYKPNMRELPDALFSLIENVWVDTPFAAFESGDIAKPLEKGLLGEKQVKPISNLVANETYDSSETSFFKSVGMALFDVLVAEYLYQKAIKENIGTQIDL
ncbi:ornithine cyclodeaminase family protein [Marinifilum caeruleilacunae]|uniref:Ornithine cyclodeaminase family protein n=1 Tax=Marinifilum caeruleilacunae TaxID=2499076 RepID=A0ABX1WW81_9BACT|nr:ornithine cyclodeaminase family protein [Marinifilum caeruleilacunae]NOU60385.1 ornithine cyclodeaminase family protein [Marinifilum caeruleilacunae]